MTLLRNKFVLLLLSAYLLGTTGCDILLRSLTYRPHTKKQQQRAKPSVVLLSKIVDFREAFGEWPRSREHLVSQGKPYKDAFYGFPYLETRFKIRDNDHMVFSFYRHIKDEARYDRSQKIDLNSYGGEVRFYKEGDKFLWKIKMH